jgi:hypothetical protein
MTTKETPMAERTNPPSQQSSEAALVARIVGGNFAYDGVKWWFLAGGRIRIGIAHHGLLQAAWDAEGMGHYWEPKGEYHRLHIGPWCLRWRGQIPIPTQPRDQSNA